MNATTASTLSINHTVEELASIARNLLKSNPLRPFPEVHQESLARCSDVAKLCEDIYPHQQLQLLQHQMKNLPKHPPLRPLCIDILGGGTAGLLAALVLGRQGHHIQLYEGRARELATLRYPNISFKEAEERLKPLLGSALYNRFFDVGASLDGNTGKLRITIGAFQEVLLQEIVLLNNIHLHFSYPIYFDDFVKHSSADMILLATGAHTHQQFGLDQDLKMHYFPEYDAIGRTALFIEASEKNHGYFRQEREGRDWRRDNTSIYSQHVMASDLHRVQKNCEKYKVSHDKLAKLKLLFNAESIEYCFSFGNDSEKFLHQPPMNSEPFLTSRYRVIPMLSYQPVFERHAKLIIAVGDANGSPHPLAAIGTLKFLRNIAHLEHYCHRLSVFKTLALDANDALSQQLVKLEKQSKTIYKDQVLQNIHYIFFGNILSSVFSNPTKLVNPL